jgi:hypothetical protein
LIIVALPSILINSIIPITQDGCLVRQFIASHLEDPVIGFTTFGILRRIPRSPLLLDFILPRGAELKLIQIAVSPGGNNRMVELVVRWRRRQGGRGWDIILAEFHYQGQIEGRSSVCRGDNGDDVQPKD